MTMTLLMIPHNTRPIIFYMQNASSLQTFEQIKLFQNYDNLMFYNKLP